ncbi:MAG: hypothetical protein ABIN10_08385 [Specibacter sp.]
MRGDEFFTIAKQAEITGAALSARAGGAMVPLAIVNSAGSIAGRLKINGIVPRAFPSAALSYWVAKDKNGQGLATAAVADAVELATGCRC